MNKKIILSLSAAVLLASSLYAYGPQGGNKQGCNQQKKMMMKKGGRHSNKGGSLMKMMRMLDLTDTQRTEIKSILQAHMKNKVNPYDAFSANNFDKAKFIKLTNEKRDNRAERKAELISKIYKVLNSTQKKNLKTLLDMKAMQKNKMMKSSYNGNNCRGNR